MKHSIKKTITATFLLCAFACAVFAQTSGHVAPPDATIVTGELGTRLDQYLTRLAGYGFSGAVLVARGDAILLHKGYGFADAQRGVPNSTQTVYDIASIAKQFTAAAILKLETRGKLKTTDPLSKHFASVPNDKRAITLHHLLTHTSGLKFDCAGAGQMNREQFVKCMLESKLDAEPGQRYSYSNAGLR